MTRIFLSVLGASVLALGAFADQVVLRDGSLLKGRILHVGDGQLQVATTFAGTVSIALEEVRTFATDDAVNISMAGSPTVLAHVYAAESGVTLQSEAMRLTAHPTQVTDLWPEGAESPHEKVIREITEKMRRKWSYEASAAIAGRTGASEKINVTAGLKTTLASDHDRLILTGIVERAQDNGVQTANREFGGADYSTFFSTDQGWYMRTSLETDKIKAIDSRSTTAAGFTRKLIRRSSLDLEFRSGASYLYESYSTGKNFNSPGLDLTLLNTWAVRAAKLTTSLTYVPTFRDFANYRLHHESGLEVPISISLWKLKVGLSNDFQSIPASGVDRFDTTYFTSLLLNWK